MKDLINLKYLILFFALAYISSYQIIFAQQNQLYRGTITQIISNETNFNEFQVKLNTNEEIRAIQEKGTNLYKVGDQVTLFKTVNSDNNQTFYITDHNRLKEITYLFIGFVLIVVIISRSSGIMSLLGMAYTFFIIIKFLLPQLSSGANVILTTLLAVIFIAPVSFILSHGFNKKTFSALISAIIALTFTSLLALIFINTAHLTGFGSEEAYFLMITNSNINIKGILLAGIVIGTLGILDDATITQSSIVGQLKGVNSNLSKVELFSRAMQVGHDHIASTVNTLILVYTGAALPLLLLFVNANISISEVINTQIVAEEIVTMLVSSIGLILSIPIATFVATFIVADTDEHDKGHFHFH